MRTKEEETRHVTLETNSSAARSDSFSRTKASEFPAQALRTHFPALVRAGSFIFADNAAGAQVPQQVLDAINQHLIEHNVQRGGRYPHSVAVDAMIAHARASVAAFVNARRTEEVAFGMN